MAVPYCRFTKLIICHLGRIHNIHQRSASPFHLAEEDLRLGNLKFVSKGEVDEVFGIPIPNKLISNNIRNSPYSNAYMEMVAKHDRKVVAEQGGKKKSATAKQPKPKPANEKSSKPTPVLKPKATKETPAKPSPVKPSKMGKVNKIRKGADTDKTNSGGDTEILQFDEEQGKDVDNQVNLNEKTDELDQGQARSNPANEHVILEEPLSSSRTLFSMKNLDDAYTIRDQFLNDKPTKDELELEQNLAAFEQKSKTLDNTTQNLRSRVFILELQDLPHKINQTVNEVVKEAVHIALQAPLRDRFRELAEADIKEILHQRMIESGSYKSILEHVALYEALEASMERENKDEFLAEKDKSRKRRRDDQDPPLPPLDSDPSKKRRYDSGASEEDIPATPEPDWTIPPNELSEPENNWANVLSSSYQDPEEYKLLRQTGDMSSFINWFCKRIGKKKHSKKQT
uniref:Uncharacterized protein n=1 Tax=Tanacetum cinerariifolium TaxID=118510 RepID=A0A699IRI3_TANCI|nr:hypothetical protein [Tanacetum cinerariifolium]